MCWNKWIVTFKTFFLRTNMQLYWLLHTTVCLHTGTGIKVQQNNNQIKWTSAFRIPRFRFTQFCSNSLPIVLVGQLQVQFGSQVLWGDVSFLFFSLIRASICLSVSKPTVISPEILWKVRWLPRLSQPVQCKDRKSQGSTPHTPTRKPSKLKGCLRINKKRKKKHHTCTQKIFWFVRHKTFLMIHIFS